MVFVTLIPLLLIGQIQALSRSAGSMEGYYTLAEIRTILAGTVSANPNIAVTEDFAGTTLGGKTIPYIKIASSSGLTAKKSVIVSGGL